MTLQGDTKRPRSVNLEIDPLFGATAQAGALLIEQTMRSLGIARILKTHLPARAEQAEFTSDPFAYGLLAALQLGGDGIDAMEPLRQDHQTCQLFGLDKVPSDSTTYRVLCDMAGLDQRLFAETYEAAGPAAERLDMFGQAQAARKHRRRVPEQPEAAKAPRRRQLRRAERAVARACLKRLRHKQIRLHGWTVVFGDGSDLAVDGRCFDAARLGRKGEMIFRWMTLRVGPVLVDQDLLAGNADEGRTLLGMLLRARPLLAEAGGRGRLLALLDAAFCEWPVVKALPRNTDWIICANQHRAILTRLAMEQPKMVWRSQGADARRGWEESQVCLLTHWFGGWDGPVTIAARRWREQGELPGIWHYSFLATNLEPCALPPQLARKHGPAQTLWMLYSTKQGQEDHFKTPLRCLGLHHPPSGRLGVNQVYYGLASMAANIAMVLRHVVLPEPQRGMTLSRIRRQFFQVAGYLVRSGRKLTVRLAGAALSERRQTQLLLAFANAKRL